MLWVWILRLFQTTSKNLRESQISNVKIGSVNCKILLKNLFKINGNIILLFISWTCLRIINFFQLFCFPIFLSSHHPSIASHPPIFPTSHLQSLMLPNFYPFAFILLPFTFCFSLSELLIPSVSFFYKFPSSHLHTFPASHFPIFLPPSFPTSQLLSFIIYFVDFLSGSLIRQAFTLSLSKKVIILWSSPKTHSIIEIPILLLNI